MFVRNSNSMLTNNRISIIIVYKNNLIDSSYDIVCEFDNLGPYYK